MEAKDKLKEAAKELTAEFVSALAKAGKEKGLGDEAEEIAKQAVLGSAELVRKSGVHPIELADRVCSPGGTTIEGLLSLKKDNFEGIITDYAEEKMK
ncbi:MAG: hypothetical protein IJF20_02870 [Clostridia bacterium]|nr:hypothetical protein [Oscillospiraceae bacterium]MBQ2828165.1 hypothetical protein [Clostridia bacterium]